MVKLKHIIDVVLGAKRLAAVKVFIFYKKNKLLEKIVEKINCPALSAPTLLSGQVQIMFQRLHFRVKFSKWLG